MPLICVIEFDDEAVELDNGSARYWVGTELKYEGHIDGLPPKVIEELIRIKVIRAR
jgi:hypothetical protein